MRTTSVLVFAFSQFLFFLFVSFFYHARVLLYDRLCYHTPGVIVLSIMYYTIFACHIVIIVIFVRAFVCCPSSEAGLQQQVASASINQFINPSINHDGRNSSKILKHPRPKTLNCQLQYYYCINNCRLRNIPQDKKKKKKKKVGHVSNHRHLS